MFQGQCSGLVPGSDKVDFATKVSDLVLGDSKLHECRVHLDAQGLDRSSRHSLDRVWVHGAAEVMQIVHWQLTVPEALLLAASEHEQVVDLDDHSHSHRREMPDDGLQNLRCQPGGWC